MTGYARRIDKNGGYYEGEFLNDTIWYEKNIKYYKELLLVSLSKLGVCWINRYLLILFS
jgi:hypothetical protein